MADSDLSRIVNLIMENPNLIEQIKGLAKSEGDNKPTADSPLEVSAPQPTQEADGKANEYVQTSSSFDSPRVRRRELLCALKPYVSEKRSQAIDSMLTIVDILDVMRSK